MDCLYIIPYVIAVPLFCNAAGCIVGRIAGEEKASFFGRLVGATIGGVFGFKTGLILGKAIAGRPIPLSFIGAGLFAMEGFKAGVQGAPSFIASVYGKRIKAYLSMGTLFTN